MKNAVEKVFLSYLLSAYLPLHNKHISGKCPVTAISIERLKIKSFIEID